MPPQTLQRPSDLKLLHGIFIPCLISLIAFRSSRCLFVLLTCLSAYVLIQYSKHNLDGTGDHGYQVGVSWSLMLATGSHLILLNDPQLDFRFIGQKEAAYKLPTLPRLWWATTLLFNPRGINWNCEIPGLRRSKLPKWAFVRSRIGSAILSFLVHDILKFHTTTNASFQSSSRNGVAMGSVGFLWQMWNVMVYWLIIATCMQCLHSSAAATAVAVGWSSVGDWPAWFGPCCGAVSVRKIWGQAWHQSLRQVLGGHGKYVTRRLNFPQGSSASAYTQLYIAFLISGMLHSAGEWVARHSVDGVKNTMTFFMLQAVAITFEDVIIAGWERLGVGIGIGEHSLFSYVWVLLWFTWSSPLWFDSLIAGAGGSELPFCLLGFLVKNNLVGF